MFIFKINPLFRTITTRVSGRTPSFHVESLRLNSWWHLQVGLENAPFWNPREWLPINVDNTLSDGLLICLGTRQVPLSNTYSIQLKIFQLAGIWKIFLALSCWQYCQSDREMVSKMAQWSDPVLEYILRCRAAGLETQRWLYHHAYIAAKTSLDAVKSKLIKMGHASSFLLLDFKKITGAICKGCPPAPLETDTWLIPRTASLVSSCIPLICILG